MRCGPRAACSTVCPFAEPRVRLPAVAAAGLPMTDIRSIVALVASARADWKHRASSRAGRRCRRPRLCRHRQCGAESGASPYRIGFRLLEQYRRLRYQPDADRLFREHVDFRPRLLGRPSQHASGRRHRHRACDRARLCHRHRAAVAQLAGRAAGRRLCGIDPQHTAPAATFVLVQRRAQIAARIARQRRASRRRLSQ